MRIQSPRPLAMQTATTLDEVCEHHLATLLARQPHGPYYCKAIRWAGRAGARIAARLRARGETVAFLGLPGHGAPETQNWREKAIASIGRIE